MAEGPYTLAKMHPAMDRIQVEPAELEGYVQYPGSDCRNGALLKVRDGHALMKSWSSHHNCLVARPQACRDRHRRPRGRHHNGKDRMMKPEEVLAVLKKHVVIPVIAIEIRRRRAGPCRRADRGRAARGGDHLPHGRGRGGDLPHRAATGPSSLLGAGTILTKENLRCRDRRRSPLRRGPGAQPRHPRRGQSPRPALRAGGRHSIGNRAGPVARRDAAEVLPRRGERRHPDDQGPVRPVRSHGSEVRAHGRGERRQPPRVSRRSRRGLRRGNVDRLEGGDRRQEMGRPSPRTAGPR